jgi:hypothetical protein
MLEFSHRIESCHPPEDVWKAINTPLDPDLVEVVNPGALIRYEELDIQSGLIVSGTRITYAAEGSLIRRIVPQQALGILPVLLPDEIFLDVEKQEGASRRDVVGARQFFSGFVMRTVVESGKDGSPLEVSGKVSVPGLSGWRNFAVRQLFEGFGCKPDQMMAGFIARSDKNTLTHLPEIIARARATREAAS